MVGGRGWRIKSWLRPPTPEHPEPPSGAEGSKDEQQLACAARPALRQSNVSLGKDLTFWRGNCLLDKFPDRELALTGNLSAKNPC